MQKAVSKSTFFISLFTFNHYCAAAPAVVSCYSCSYVRMMFTSFQMRHVLSFEPVIIVSPS